MCTIIPTDGVATMATHWCTIHESPSQQGGPCVDAMLDFR